MIRNAEDIDRWVVGHSTDRRRLYVIHAARPAFLAEMIARDDGGYESVAVRFFDEPPPDAPLLAKLMRETGEALSEYFDDE